MVMRVVPWERKWADVNGDGKFDLFVPDFTFTCLYINQGGGFFEDQARQAGIAIPCSRYVSWGAAVADLDLDTDLDILRVQRRRTTTAGDSQSGVPE